MKQSTSRLDAAKKSFEAAGGKITSFYLTVGQYDAVAIAELPGDEALAKIALAMAAQGNVRTETLRAFKEDEYRNIIGSLP